MTESPIQHVSDTAFWVATYRAWESERPDALFHDPLAARLVAGRGQEIARQMDGATVAWSVSIRTVIIDAYVERAVAEGFDAVVNLGAGLDTRPYRMSLPAGLRWFELDFPEVLAFKQARLAGETPRCVLVRLGVDLSDVPARRAAFAQVAAEARKILLLTEGFIPYLTVEQAAGLADAIQERPEFTAWVVDRFTGKFMRRRDVAPHHKQMERTPFRFWPVDWDGFFALHGWRRTATRFLGAEAHRLGRGRPPAMPWWFGIVMRFMPERMRREIIEMSGYAWMERTASRG